MDHISDNNPHLNSVISPKKFNRRKWKNMLKQISPNLISISMLLLLILSYMPMPNKSALLTDLYGKKLSELTDFENRYLLIPTGTLVATSEATNSSIAENNPDNSNQKETGTLNTQTRVNLLPEAMALQSQPQTVPTWRSVGVGGQQTSNNLGDQYQPANSKRLLNITNSQEPTILLPNYESPSGDPKVSKDVVTEFPNPNINNLGHEITKILNKFFVYGYDKRVRPNYSGPPALVNVSFHIIGISSVDEVQMDFTTDFYFRQKWYDPRLEFAPVGEVNELCVGNEFAERIWLPDTFFANEKTATFHKATTENTFIRIMHTGGVYRSIRLTVTCSCPMDLQYFPMDRQRCKIEIESYGYNTRDIDYRWERGDKSVSLETKIELPQFKILGFRMGQELQNLSSGDYIRLYCEIHFVRSMGYYLIQIYIPASLIVMISWVSFWLHRNATPARVALGVTTVLTMTTLMSSTNAALPKISYIKSIDVFLGTCFVMVFASLLEYASVGYIGKRIAMKRKRLQELQQMQQHHQKVCVAAAASAAAAAAANTGPVDLHHIGGASQITGLISQGKSSKLGLGANNSAQGKASESGQIVVRQLQVPLESGGTEESTGRPSTTSQTLQRRATTASQAGATSKTLSRIRISGNHEIPNNDSVNSADYGQRSAIKVMLDNNPSGPQGQYFHNSASQCQGNGAGNFASVKRRIVAPIGVVPSPPEIGSTGQQANGQRGKQSIILPSLPLSGPQPNPALPTVALNSTAEFEVSQTHDMIRICGLTPSAIDKHSRVVFPICFVCFNLMYWIIYGHISQQVEDKGSPLIPFIKS